MRLVINPQVLLRHEFFGGIFHSRDDGSIMEITHEDAIFVWALNGLGDPGMACEVFRMIFPGSTYYPSVKPFIDEGLIVEVNSEVAPVDIAKMVARGKARLDEAKSRTYLRAPLSLSIYPSMACNQRCKFCFVDEVKRGIKEASLEDWLRLITEIKSLDIPLVSILGGEPTIYPGLPKIIERIESLGLKANLTTNGITIAPELSQLLCDSKRITVCFSVQSLDQHHKSFTGIPSMVVQKTIKKFIANGGRCNINTVYTGQSIRQLTDLAVFCLDNGVEKLSLSIYNTNGIKNTPPISQIRSTSEKVRDELSKISDSDNLIFTVEGCLLYSAYPEFTNNPVSTELDRLIYGCEAGQTVLEVLPNGQSLPCILFPTDYKPSNNIFEVGIQKIWDNDPLLSEVRGLQSQDSSCHTCHFFSFCNGGCPSVQKAVYGKMGVKGDSRCEIRAQKEVTKR